MLQNLRRLTSISLQFSKSCSYSNRCAQFIPVREFASKRNDKKIRLELTSLKTPCNFNISCAHFIAGDRTIRIMIVRRTNRKHQIISNYVQQPLLSWKRIQQTIHIHINSMWASHCHRSSRNSTALETTNGWEMLVSVWPVGCIQSEVLEPNWYSTIYAAMAFKSNWKPLRANMEMKKHLSLTMRIFVVEILLASKVCRDERREVNFLLFRKM